MFSCINAETKRSAILFLVMQVAVMLVMSGTEAPKLAY